GRGGAKATFFFRKLSLLIVLLLVGITIFVEGGIAALLSWGTLSEGNHEIVALTGWLFPAILFICLYGVNISLLNCYDSFFIPSIAPIICNITWIGAALFLRNKDPSMAMPTLAKWIVIGFIGQWMVTLPLTLRHTAAHWKEWFKFHIPQEVKDLAKAFALGAIGVGAMQINAFVDALFARYADIRGPAYLWYSIRLEQLALAIFGIACISAVVPRLSRAIKSNDMVQAQDLFALSYKRILAVMIPCTFAIIAMGTAAVNLIYGRGLFTEFAIGKTTVCLWAYGLGLVPTTLVILFSAIFYAQNNFRMPMFISVFTVIVNIVLNAIFVFGFKMGAISTALATSISAFINGWILYRMTGKMGWKPEISPARIFKISCAGCFAFLCAFTVDYFMSSRIVLSPLMEGALNLPRDVAAQLMTFVMQFVAFAAGLLFYAYAFKCTDLIELLQDFVFRKKAAPEIE
ncbi:MAG TPA: lipid II flippase MurJ, partial [Rhabdochlamydiaceae bacterium]|nr:lipid II flippase MurJ [Rhabdochlamydiaceae bacterium]